MEVQKSRSPVITISGDAKGVSVVAGLVPATSRMGNEKSRRQKTEDGSPVITIRGDAKGVSVVAGLVPATSRMGNEKSGRQKTEVQSLRKEDGRQRED